ncbi:hypothetical protein EVAR_48201_1 [Eumeta japonica]|uniref:Uncharacterized protein n=1 Tax=Eumeta variegata TaxID=151549 RepID=A0A4C1XVZ7_EUMVA|nr:hypothetical protein EVAR_48201_1 [Eumeta japonica]
MTWSAMVLTKHNLPHGRFLKVITAASKVNETPTQAGLIYASRRGSVQETAEERSGGGEEASGCVSHVFDIVGSESDRRNPSREPGHRPNFVDGPISADLRSAPSQRAS